MSKCSRCGRYYQDDPNHAGFPDLHECNPPQTVQVEVPPAVMLAAYEDIADRCSRIIRQAIRLCIAVEHGDPALVEPHIRDAAAGFRATIEENT